MAKANQKTATGCAANSCRKDDGRSHFVVVTAASGTSSDNLSMSEIVSGCSSTGGSVAPMERKQFEGRQSSFGRSEKAVWINTLLSAGRPVLFARSFRADIAQHLLQPARFFFVSRSWFSRVFEEALRSRTLIAGPHEVSRRALIGP